MRKNTMISFDMINIAASVFCCYGLLSYRFTCRKGISFKITSLFKIMKKLTILTFILFFTLNSFSCPKVKEVSKGSKITIECDGFFVQKEQMHELVKKDEMLEVVKDENLKLKQLSLKQKDLSDYYKDRNNELKREISRERTKSSFKSIGYFILGVAATSLAAYAAIQSTR